MTELTRLLYNFLVELLTSNPNARINYRVLAPHFRPYRRLSWRGGPMHEALGELVAWCRVNNRSLLPALVVRVKDGIPGDGFFAVAFPGVTERAEQRRLWREEIERLGGEEFPPLPE